MLRKDGLISLGSEFGLSGYSLVSSVLAGMKTQIHKSRQMKKRFEEIEKRS
jgi:hypothetical protein